MDIEEQFESFLSFVETAEGYKEENKKLRADILDLEDKLRARDKDYKNHFLSRVDLLECAFAGKIEESEALNKDRIKMLISSRDKYKKELLLSEKQVENKDNELLSLNKRLKITEKEPPAK